jgi:signal transduction histidine kinase
MSAPDVATSAAELDEMWRRQQVWWHSLFAALLLLVGVLLVLDDPSGRLTLDIALLAALGVDYAVLGRRALAGCGQGWSWSYLVIAWLLVVALVGGPNGGYAWVLSFGLFPHTWAMLRNRSALAMTIIAVGAITVVELAQSDSGESTTGVLIGAGISLALASLLGVFIDRITSEASSRAQVIDELRRTRADLAAAERAGGVYAERERISREIHDTLAQGFTSVLALARATSSALDRDDIGAVRSRLKLIEETATDNLSEARLIVAELSPGHLRSRTLPEALERLVEAVARETGLAGTFEVEGTPEVLGTNVDVVLLRTAQEALSNVRRHADAGSYAVRLAFGERSTVLTVSDDGCGFASEGRATGYGLDGAAARAAAVDAHFEVVSAPGEGTAVRIEVPR